MSLSIRASKSPYGCLEQLEARLALAGVVSFVDVDGDAVTVRSSKGTTPELEAALTLEPSGIGTALRAIDLKAAVFQGTKLTVTVNPGALSDAQVNIGHIDATGRDLKAISVAGDVGRIRVGDATSPTPAFSSLALRSLGVNGTQTGAPDLESVIVGNIGSIRVARDVQRARLLIYGRGTSVSIGGDVVADVSDGSGQIICFNKLKTFSIAGNLVGGPGSSSGAVQVSAQSFAIGGSIVGGMGERSGTAIVSSKRISLGNTISGGGGLESGVLYAGARQVAVGGFVVGGEGARSGSIQPLLSDTTVSIRLSLLSGAGSESGSIIGYSSIKKVTLGGNMTGSATEPALIRARNAIGSVKVAGSVTSGLIRAGYAATDSYDPSKDEASKADIGSVRILGDCTNTSIVAGAAPGPLGYGVGDTVAIGNSSCTIGVIAVGGSVADTTALQAYGFVARAFKSVSIGGQKRVIPAPGQTEAIGDTDVYVHRLG